MDKLGIQKLRAQIANLERIAATSTGSVKQHLLQQIESIKETIEKEEKK